MLLELIGIATWLGSKLFNRYCTYLNAFSMYPTFDRHIPSISSSEKLNYKL